MISSGFAVAATETPAKKASLALLFCGKYWGRAVLALCLCLTVGGNISYHFFFPVPPIHFGDHNTLSPNIESSGTWPGGLLFV